MTPGAKFSVTTLQVAMSRSARSRPFGRAHVDGDAELVAAVVVEQPAPVGIGVDDLLAEVARRLVLVDRQPARRVDPDPVLDLDDLGAEVGEQPRGDRPDSHPAEVRDPDAGQRPAAGLGRPIHGPAHLGHRGAAARIDNAFHNHKETPIWVRLSRHSS